MADAALIVEALRSVYDPCCRERGISVVDMGLIRAVNVDGPRAKIELVLTSGWCPFASRMLSEVRRVVEELPGTNDASVEVVWDEAWTTDRMSKEALAKLRFLPEPAQVADRQRYIETHSRGSSSSVQEVEG